MDATPDTLTLVWEILKAAYAVSIGVILLIIILENRNPIRTITWIVVLLTLPGIGILFYIFFGQKIRQRKRHKHKSLKNDLELKERSKSGLSTGANPHRNDTVDEHIHTVLMLKRNSDALLTRNNTVDLITEGREMLEMILQAIEGAQSFIHIEYYIFADDEAGRRVADALERKADAGIEVRMLVDDVGSWELPSAFFDEMKRHNVMIDSFLPVRFPKFTGHVNYRNHRKIVIVDGQVAFVGGMNMAQRYVDGGETFGHWHDTHLRIKGDAINFIQSVFAYDWYMMKREELSENKYFPRHHTSASGTAIQVASSGPDAKWPAIMMGMFSIISRARHHVYITTPYLMPGETILTALKAAAMGGVDVRIIIPQKSDSWIADHCSKSYVKELLEANIRVYLYQDGFLHGKTLEADRTAAIVGSANMDFRSFEQNFELSAFIYDRDVAQRLFARFESDFERAQLITTKAWKHRPFMQRAKESFARVLSPLL